MIKSSPVVKLDHIPVLQLQLSLRDLERMDIAHLSANRNVQESAFLDFGGIQEVFRVKLDLVEDEDEELAREPFFDIFRRLAVWLILAHLEPDGDLLGSCRLVVSVDDSILRAHAL